MVITESARLKAGHRGSIACKRSSRKVRDAAMEQPVQKISGRSCQQSNPLIPIMALHLASGCASREAATRAARSPRRSSAPAEKEIHLEALSENRPKAIPAFTLWTRSAKLGTSGCRKPSAVSRSTANLLARSAASIASASQSQRTLGAAIRNSRQPFPRRLRFHGGPGDSARRRLGNRRSHRP